MESSGFDRRMQQFQDYIEPMYRRSQDLQEFCFIVFEESFAGADGGVRRSAAKARPKAIVAGVSAGPGFFAPDETGLLDALDADMEDEYPRNRYVQIGFDEYYFFMDMPVASIFTDEADRITSSRRGFRYASENPLAPTTEKDIEDFDPLQKFYFPGEEPETAEDVAHIFFEVWGLPTDTRLYVSSHSGSGRTWERGEPFE